MRHNQHILIIDFGSQFTQLIARSIREENILSKIVTHSITANEVEAQLPIGIILSGGPMSVYDNDAPLLDPRIFELGIPILGICYGLQILSYTLGGKVESADDREYGKAIVSHNGESSLFNGVSSDTTVWMSHGDHVTAPPQGFEVIASSENCPISAIENIGKRMYGVQFHPEVMHSLEGKKVLKNFLFGICNASGDWTSESFIDNSIAKIRETVGEGNVICALSGGVDSTVAAVLVQRAIGERLHCIHIDHGVMRKNESSLITAILKDSLKLNLKTIDASELFLSRLEGVSDPEQKRKIIGKTFIDVFEEEAKKIENVSYLVQGTLYPDVIESVSVKGQSVTIKSHHNVGGLPEKMNLKLIEPLRELFKDEVRRVGKELGIEHDLLARHPFPGPGLAVRILGDITREKIAVLQDADDIFISELKRTGIYEEIWQAFAVLLPVNSVGVMGDSRTYENVLALRAVTSRDGMTADWYRMDQEILADISNKIINKVKGVNRVVYDVSSKPPATIEWE